MTKTAAPEELPSPAIAGDEGCAAAIAVIGRLEREIAAIETAKSAAVAKATQEAEDKATPLQKSREALAAAVAAWCEANRGRLTRDGETKTVSFATGECAWRLGKAGVEIDRQATPKIIAALEQIRGFKRFLKVTTTVSAQAILSATDAEKARLARIRGITFLPAAEAFAIKPVEAPLADRPPPDDAA